MIPQADGAGYYPYLAMVECSSSHSNKDVSFFQGRNGHGPDGSIIVVRAIR